jgi:hypothetical protein
MKMFAVRANMVHGKPRHPAVNCPYLMSVTFSLSLCRASRYKVRGKHCLPCKSVSCALCCAFSGKMHGKCTEKCTAFFLLCRALSAHAKHPVSRSDEKLVWWVLCSYVQIFTEIKKKFLNLLFCSLEAFINNSIEIW